MSCFKVALQDIYKSVSFFERRSSDANSIFIQMSKQEEKYVQSAKTCLNSSNSLQAALQGASPSKIRAYSTSAEMLRVRRQHFT